MDFYFTIETNGYAEYTDRGSKFLAYTFPIKSAGDFKKYIQALKKEHAKASHHCFAYRIGYDGNNFRVSDDGEPPGTAGKQILSQVNSANLSDILVIVVRYFGGTLLGIPGLINAYKTSTTLALQCTPVIKRYIELNYILQFNYPEMNTVMLILKKYNCTVYKNETQLFCKIIAGVPKYRLAETLYELRNVMRLEIEKAD